VREALEASGATAQEIDQAIRERSFLIPEGELTEPEHAAGGADEQ